ncbi:hypothetical protein [Bdellovibrio sp. HCB209]|uniref:hypothetical protein n=1 Tax=Bdellovibrio sp. HCB209 TaxID=3394354 RepID=UPI0039B47A1C
MKTSHLLLSIVILGALATYWVRKKDAEVTSTVSAPVVVNTIKNAPPVNPADKALSLFARVLEQSDSIHREAWWVLSGDRRPLGKSPFGKAQRAILSQQNAKLANKSLFRCDRYEVKRDVMSASGYPQKIDMYEKCSAKSPAKHMAFLSAMKPGEIDIVFYPEGLEEVLGISAAILNRTITCQIRLNTDEQLESLKCKDWAQEKTREQMIRLDVYDYSKDGNDMIKLRGKIYENLTDIRKIEADVPMTGKIVVTETELYAPTPIPTPSPSPTPQKPAVAADGQQTPGQPQAQPQASGSPAATPPPVIDMTQPDPGQVTREGIIIGAPGVEPPPVNPATEQGWPTDEQGNVIENPQPLDEEGNPVQQQEPQQQEPLNDQGAPSGR